MAHRTNPFLERMSERTTSDQEFVRLFSPKVLERLDDNALTGAVHVFRSPPGGGKTTLLRAFTPPALRAFWNARRVQEMSESYQRLVASEVLDEQSGPQVLGVLLSCASGYADLPPGASLAHEGLFRALLNCRIVLRSLRSLASLLDLASEQQMAGIRIEYAASAADLQGIPALASPLELIRWAEQRERRVYGALDSVGDTRGTSELPSDLRFDGVLWLQSARFVADGRTVAPKRLLMIDDLHKLRRKQRALVIEELTELRPAIPVWLAERNIALGEELLSQGSRSGRDVHEYPLEEIWSSTKGFLSFAQSVLDRRLQAQSSIPAGAFSQYLSDRLQTEDVRPQLEKGFSSFRAQLERYRSTPRYREWLGRMEQCFVQPSLESLGELYTSRVLLARDESRRQLSLDIALPAEQLDDRDSSALQGAVEVFMHEELGIPHYFGIDRLAVLSTFNIEELLALAAVMYEGLLAKQILRRRELILSPQEQEKLLLGAAKAKRDFIPKTHTEGTRAQRMLDSIGLFCRERTFVRNAPIAPGVTGIRLSQREESSLGTKPIAERSATLRRVLAECVAENLLVTRPSAASASRDSGTVYYLNRTLCAHYGLPLQMGGWQDVSSTDLIEWMEHGKGPVRRGQLEI